MKLKKSDIGNFIAVRFLDHCITKGDTDEPIEIEAIGRLVKVNKSRAVLETWTPVTPDPLLRGQNSEKTIILQSAILKVFYLQLVEKDLVNEDEKQ